MNALEPVTRDPPVTDDRVALYRRVAETLDLCIAGIVSQRDPRTSRTTDLVVDALTTAKGDLAAWADELGESQ